jgi:hypothetical protein
MMSRVGIKEASKRPTPEVDIMTGVFRDFIQPLQSNAGIGALNKLTFLPHNFPIYYLQYNSTFNVSS